MHPDPPIAASTRRRALAAIAATTFAPLAAAAAGREAVVDPAMPTAARVASSLGGFAIGLPRLAPLRGLSDGDLELRCDALAVRGRWPAGLSGRFWRNGPSLFERGGERYRHWFAGDGMVQRFTIGPHGIAHVGRFVQTPKLTAEQSAGRFLMSAFGSVVAGAEGRPIGGPDALNVANTSVVEHAGRVLALWEGGSAFELDRQTLTTRGAVTWRDDLAQLPFSAHPKIEASGHLWNFGTSGNQLVVWHLDPAGHLVAAQTATLPRPCGMAHDIAVTARHLVLPLPAISVDHAAIAAGSPLAEAMPFARDEPLLVLVMAKDDITRRRVFALPPGFVFHVANAHETRDGTIELSFIGARDPETLVEGATELVAGRAAAAPRGAAMHVARLDMASGRVGIETFFERSEFPRIDPRRIGLPARRVVSAASWRRDVAGGLFHGVQVRDLASGRVDRHDYGVDAVVEEHVVVPKPGATAERDAWLLGTRYDARRGVTVLAVLDAAHVADGPLAEAALPYALPLGFHGHFAAAQASGR